jgi:hypothetical protein
MAALGISLNNTNTTAIPIATIPFVKRRSQTVFQTSEYFQEKKNV